MSLAEPYATRSVRCLDLLTFDAVIGHERAAWLRHVLARAKGPDLDAYVADRLHAEV